MKIGQSYQQGSQSKDDGVSDGAASHSRTRYLSSQREEKQDLYKSSEQSESLGRMESQDMTVDVCGNADRRRLRDSSTEREDACMSGNLLTGVKTYSWSDDSPQHGKKGGWLAGVRRRIMRTYPVNGLLPFEIMDLKIEMRVTGDSNRDRPH